MDNGVWGKRTLWIVGILILTMILILPSHVVAGKGGVTISQGKWWDVVPEEENPSPYYDSILYSEVAPTLREIEKNSNRVKVDVIGQSAGGRNLFFVTVSNPGTSGRFGHYKSLRKMMIKDPEKALEKLDQYKDFKVPFFVNGSIHGDEYAGTDACIRLIEKLAYDDSEEVQAILDNTIILFNVVQNPDGRVLGTRSNSVGFDVNRDFISQTQPESKVTAALIAEWNPMVFLDLHGFVSPMLIEPCSPPHNPNYEHDLYIEWALNQAKAMESAVYEKTGYTSQIPFRDWDFDVEGYYWDDWPPIYTPMYAMYHGAYGHTIETPAEDESGVEAHYWAVWGALNFVVENKDHMIRDQIEIFRRGFLDMPQFPIPDYIMEQAAYPDFERLGIFIQEFPAAYVIPADGPMQLSQHQPANLIEFLLHNDVQVEKATQRFMLDGIDYPKGTYIVWMDQPKRGLANTILEKGLDVSNLGIEDLVFYSPPTAWSHPLLWGVNRVVMKEKQSIKTSPVKKVGTVMGSVESGFAGAYAYRPTSIAAFQATNALLTRGVAVNRTKASFEDAGRQFTPGTLLVNADPGLASELAGQWGLELFAVEGIPETAVALKNQRIAVYADEGVRYCLETLGFAYDELSTSDLNGGIINGFDLFINRNKAWSGLDPIGQASFETFFEAGGDYIGLLGAWTYFSGATFAVDAEIIEVQFDFSWDPDAIIQIDFDEMDTIAAGFRSTDFAYTLTGAWFTDYPEDANVAASISPGDFLVAGFWPGWQTSPARGKPVVIHRASGENGIQDTALIAFDATFRGHPENTFRLIGNAIYDGIE